MANEGEKLEQGTTTWRVAEEPLYPRPYVRLWLVDETGFYFAEVKDGAKADQIVADHNAAHLLETAKAALRTLSNFDGGAYTPNYKPTVDRMADIARDALKSLEAGK